MQDSVAAYQRELRATQRSADIAAVENLDKRLRHLQEMHLQEFTEVQRPTAPIESTGGEALASGPEADAAWDALLRNEPAAVIASIEHAFEDNEVPAAAVGCEGAEVMLLMTIGEPEQLIPERCPDETPAGRPTIRRRTKTEVNEEYAYLLASNVLATVKEAFACAPAISRARVVVITHASAEAEHLLTPIYCAAFARDKFAETKWKQVDAVDLIEDADDALIAFYGRTDELVPIDLTDHNDLAEALEAIARQLGLTLDPDSAPENDGDTVAERSDERERGEPPPRASSDTQPTAESVAPNTPPPEPEKGVPKDAISPRIASSLRPLVEALQDEDSEVRYRAMRGLGDHLDSTLLSTIQPLLHDQDNDIRRLAVEYYAQIGASDTAARLIEALGDSDAEVRYRAMRGLGDHLDQSVLPTIESLLHDTDNDVRRLAVEYYAQLIK